MRICGVIAEYNPFHKGHALQLREARLRSECDYLIVCMSGSFTQRGEAACMDKWSRARAALRCGADAVFELPALWAVRTADVFARGGVTTLASLGIDALSFGCEVADLALLKELSELRYHEPEALSNVIRSKLAAGKSHARARGEALSEMLKLDAALLASPNLILGSEYLCAMREMQLDLPCFIVPRQHGYHDTELHEYASASAIRAAIARGEMENALRCVPENTRELLQGADQMHAPDDLLLHLLRASTPEMLSRLPDVCEGLEHRLHRCAHEVGSVEELLDRVKCKRYTRARIARCCAHALLGLDRALIARNPKPQYARLLGMRKDAGALIRTLHGRSQLPIISLATKLKGNEIFEVDYRATELRALLCNSISARRSGMEFTQGFVIE